MRKSPCGASLKSTGNSQPHGQARSPSVPVAVPPHSEAWRARSGGETCTPLEPFQQRPTGLRRQFCYYASYFLFTVVGPLLTLLRWPNGKAQGRRDLRVVPLNSMRPAKPNRAVIQGREAAAPAAVIGRQQCSEESPKPYITLVATPHRRTPHGHRIRPCMRGTLSGSSLRGLQRIVSARASL